ncbi:MAG: hypothetical protein R3B99_37230 [Polyangiales bacterium]
MACGSGTPPAAFLEPCVEALDCESGLCEDLGGSLGRRCTQECAPGSSCCRDRLQPAPRVLRVALQRRGLVVGSGTTAEVCVGGLFAACAAQDPARYCESCGCAAFGGGTCVEGRGCIEPREDGVECAQDYECRSGVCFSDGVCGTPRAMGEACREDAECETSNCSNNGDISREGVCFQALGSSCRRSDDTCSRCILPSFGDVGICSRTACDPTYAPNCPTAERRQWECARTTEGGHACFQECDEEGIFACYQSSLYCARGYCQ